MNAVLAPTSFAELTEAVRSGGKKGLDASTVPVETAFVQSRIAFMICCINPCASVQQQDDHREVASFRCRNQRSCAMAVSRIDVRSAIEQQLGPIRRPLP